MVKAGRTTPVTVTAKASADAAAGTYPIAVDVTSGSRTAHADLVGRDHRQLHARRSRPPDQRLNTNATAGCDERPDARPSRTPAPRRRRRASRMSATAPDRLEGHVRSGDRRRRRPGRRSTVVAHVTPSSDAIAGDYVVDVQGDRRTVANASADIRVTIETRCCGALVGVGLIVLVLVGLCWTFRRSAGDERGRGSARAAPPPGPTTPPRPAAVGPEPVIRTRAPDQALRRR